MSPLFRCYRAAQMRCTNPSHAAYSYYGGRGIKFLFSSFEEFSAELGPKPSPLHSIDRINNDGNYEPGNIRWATDTEQMRNRNYKPNSTGATGVYFRPQGKRIRRYQADIYVNRKRINCGCYATLEEAKAAVAAGRQKYWADESTSGGSL